MLYAKVRKPPKGPVPIPDNGPSRLSQEILGLSHKPKNSLSLVKNLIYLVIFLSKRTSKLNKIYIV